MLYLYQRHFDTELFTDEVGEDATNGTYAFTGVSAGSYMAHAAKSGLTFVDQPDVVTNASVTGVTFTTNRESFFC